MIPGLRIIRNSVYLVKVSCLRMRLITPVHLRKIPYTFMPHVAESEDMTLPLEETNMWKINLSGQGKQ